MMSGDIDSRVTDPLDGTSDSPGANDNGSGVAALLEPFDPTATFPLCLLAVSSDTDSEGKIMYDETALYDIAYYQLRNKMQAISGVVAPAVYGGKLRRILAYTDPARMESMGRSGMDVVDAIDKNIPVVIPVAACEQHGHHLPVFVDTIQVTTMA